MPAHFYEVLMGISFITGLILAVLIYRVRVFELMESRDYWRQVALDAKAENIKQVNRG